MSGTDTIDAADYVALNKRPSAKHTTDPKERRDLEDWLVATFGDTLEREYRYHDTRRWRFDWAVPGRLMAVEYDGILSRAVGHLSLGGILKDVEKRNAAQARGWTVFVAHAKNVADGTFFQLLDEWLDAQEDGRFSSRNIDPSDFGFGRKS